MPDLSIFAGRTVQGSAPAKGPQPSQSMLLMAAATVADERSEFDDLPKEEWETWKHLPAKKGRTGFGAQEKDVNIEKEIRADPHGIILDRNDPRIRKLPTDLEILNIPEEGYHNRVLGRPIPKAKYTS